MNRKKILPFFVFLSVLFSVSNTYYGFPAQRSNVVNAIPQLCTPSTFISGHHQYYTFQYGTICGQSDVRMFLKLVRKKGDISSRIMTIIISV